MHIRLGKHGTFIVIWQITERLSVAFHPPLWRWRYWRYHSNRHSWDLTLGPVSMLYGKILARELAAMESNAA